MKEKEIYREITRYIDGKLSAEETDNLWEEFVKNPEYYNWFETELHLRDLAKEANQNNIYAIEDLSGTDNAQKVWRRTKNWMLAAAAVMIVSFGLHLFSAGDGKIFHPDAIPEIEIDEMAGSDILRSDQEVTYVMDVEINRALAMSYEGDFSGASDKFKTLLSNDPDPEQRAKIEMNLGILYYNMADFKQARYYFESATRADVMNDFFREKAWWFLGNAYLNLEMIAEARDAVNNVYSENGRFVIPATTLLEKLEIELGKEGVANDK